MQGRHQVYSCCGEPEGKEHSASCEGHASIDKVTESMKLDPIRWVESYVHRSTQAVRARVLAAQNGHSVGVPRV